MLSQIHPRGSSENQCLRWMLEKVRVMQDGSPTGRVTKETKRGAPEARDSERIKRPRLGGIDGTDAERVVGEDGSMAAGDASDDNE